MKRLLRFIFVFILLLSITACLAEEKEDLNPPYFLGLTDIQYKIGDDLPSFLIGVEARDQKDGDVLSQVIIDDSSVDWLNPGQYPLFYHVKDEAGNETIASVLVIITADTPLDTTPPVFSGIRDIEYTIGDSLPSLLTGVKAFDDVDGNLTSSIHVDDSKVDYRLPGTYEIIYSVSDAKGNGAQKIASIVVKETVIPIPDVELNIFYINDTHGAIESDGNQLGLASIANLVLNEKNLNPDTTLFIGGGDLLQGNILSNYYYGSSMIDMLNAMQLDTFVLGNHEFDWGLDMVLRYADPSSGQVQANFPFLGANILRKDTMERPEFVDAYQIITKGRLKIGIIGLMGYGLEDSIATAKVSNYMFDDPVRWASHYAKYLREEQHVDVVLAVVHGSSTQTNASLAELAGSSRIDAIFNGHSHSRYTTQISRNGLNVPVIQSKANGEYVGKVTLTVDGKGNATAFQMINLHPTQSSTNSTDRIGIDTRLKVQNQTVLDLIREYKLVIADLLDEVIIRSSQSYDSRTLSLYMAEIIRLSVGADLGIHNYGGTRADLTANQDITVATLYQIFPFDNRIKYVYLSGSDIKDFVNSQVAISYKSGLSYNQLNDTTYYKVATNDYIFDKIDYPFIYGQDPVDTGYLIRDLLEDVLRNQAKTYTTFSMDRPIVLAPLSFEGSKKYLYM